MILPTDGFKPMPNRQAPQMSDPLPAGGPTGPARITNKPAPTRFTNKPSPYRGMDIKARREARRNRFGGGMPRPDQEGQRRGGGIRDRIREMTGRPQMPDIQMPDRRSTFAPPRPQQMPTYNRVMSNQPVNQGGTVGGNMPVLESAEYRGPGSSGPSTILVPQDGMAGSGVVNPPVQASTPQITPPPFNARERFEQMPSFGQGGLLQNAGFNIPSNAQRGFFNRVR